MTANEVLCRLLRPVSILTNSLPVASPTCDLLLFFAVFAVKLKFVKAMSHFPSTSSHCDLFSLWLWNYQLEQVCLLTRPLVKSFSNVQTFSVQTCDGIWLCQLFSWHRHCSCTSAENQCFPFLQKIFDFWSI